MIVRWPAPRLAWLAQGGSVDDATASNHRLGFRTSVRRSCQTQSLKGVDVCVRLRPDKTLPWRHFDQLVYFLS